MFAKLTTVNGPVIVGVFVALAAAFFASMFKLLAGVELAGVDELALIVDALLVLVPEESLYTFQPAKANKPAITAINPIFPVLLIV
jgi:hypothetical protein